MRDFQTGLTADEVRRRFRYVKSTGLLVRRLPVVCGRNSVHEKVGSIAGSLHKDGYVYTAIAGRLYLVHRLAWLWVTGEWPSGEIDHKNGKRSDNRWSNLRDATVTQNRQNTLGQKLRKGPYPGVYETTRRKGVFVAQIKHKGEVRYLGSFNCPVAARAARIEAERELFGEFAGSARPV